MKFLKKSPKNKGFSTLKRYRNMRKRVRIRLHFIHSFVTKQNIENNAAKGLDIEEMSAMKAVSIQIDTPKTGKNRQSE